DDVDRRVVDDLAPILGRALVTEVSCGTLGYFRVDIGDRRKHRNGRPGPERALRGAGGHRMDLAHPPGADQPNPQFTHCVYPPFACCALSIAARTIQARECFSIERLGALEAAV